MRGFLVTLSALCCALYCYMWYRDIQVQAWQALIWCASVFFSDLEKWLDYRLSKVYD